MEQKRRDVIVVGGGVIGVSVAYYAASQGASVLLIERGRIGCGASYGNAGLLASSHCQPLPSPGVISQGLRYLLQPNSPFYVHLKPDLDLARWLWRFCRSCSDKHWHHSVGILRKLGVESMDLHAELADSAGEQYQFEQAGLLSLYCQERALEESLEYAAQVKSYGIEITVLSGDEVRAREPEAGPQVIGGLLSQMDGRLAPEAFVAWMAGEARGKGVEFLTDTDVFWMETSHRRVTRVATTHGDFHADQIVLAGGAWTSRLTRHLGVRIPIRAAKGYSLTCSRPPGCPRLPLLLEDARVAVTPFAETLRLAGTLELGGLDLEIDRQRVQAIRTETYRYLPRLGDLEVREIWAGLRPCTPDGLPVLGRLRPYSNVLVASGHGTKGMLLGPITGKHVSQMLGGTAIGMIERSLRPHRF